MRGEHTGARRPDPVSAGAPGPAARSAAAPAGRAPAPATRSRAPRVMFWTLGPVTEPSSRFRVYQHLEGLRRSGLEVCVRPLAGPRYVELGYGRRRPSGPVRALWTAGHFAGRLARRVRDLVEARRYDVLFVQKEVLPLGLERVAGRLGLRIVYDFDDAVHLRPPLADDRGRLLRRMADAIVARERALPALLERCTAVIAGNPDLAAYARRHAARVHVLPTVVDADAYAPAAARAPGPLRIGWFGAPATAAYLEPLRPVLRELARRFEFELWVLGADAFPCRGVTTRARPWRPYPTLAEEVADLQRFDVGLMPLPGDAFAAGKCALKAIQYMACGIPVVASPVGVAREVVAHGECGFLAATADDWLAHLEALLSDTHLRQRLGRAGRARVLARYSLRAALPRLAAVLADAAAAPPRIR